MAEPGDRLDDHPASALAACWALYLEHDRRRSRHTVRAYVSTALRFLAFLGKHRGQPIDTSDLLNVPAGDLRAFLAPRRGEGLGASSAARELSAVRAFLTYAAEQQGEHAVLPRTRAPKRPRTLPRPATPEEALELADTEVLVKDDETKLDVGVRRFRELIAEGVHGVVGTCYNPMAAALNEECKVTPVPFFPACVPAFDSFKKGNMADATFSVAFTPWSVGYLGGAIASKSMGKKKFYHQS